MTALVKYEAGGVWASRIVAAWQKSRESIIEVGGLLTEAKDSLPHGEFEAMVESELPFGARTARRLMTISGDARLTNRTHVSVLPASWGTLYELTKLSDDEWGDALNAGVIHSDMQRNEITVWRKASRLGTSAPCRTDAVADLAALADSVEAGERDPFAAIYADPPWSFKVYSGKGKSRSAENHYDTMDQTGIEALGEYVSRLATKDSVLFLWAVMPQIPEALRVIEAWGFTYKTMAFTWVKQNKLGDGFKVGMGYWTRSNAEICMLATKGSPQRLAKDVRQLIVTPVGAHSSKPSIVHERIERLVGGPYLEMFGRRKCKNWTVWGNDVSPDLLDSTLEATE